ncbi:MAG: tripartite tricarboxylate transporter TctB family protein [Sphaerochaetaceae bacterium]|nr:tripartite tricarboxylate transporter TctB family protein [Sphaerochaetaceae bacterium]
MKKGNVIFGSIVLLFMCYLLFLTYQIPKPMSEYEMGAGYVPTVYLYTAIFLLVSILIKEFLKKDDSPVNVSRRALFFFLIIVAYVIGIRFIGYYIPTFVVLTALLFLLGERRKKILLTVPIGFIVFIFVVFQKILHVRF